MRKHLGAVAFGISALVGTAQGAAAADMGMIMLPNAKSVQWTAAPASLPIKAKISLIAGDPGQPGPFTLRLEFPANTIIAPHTHSKLESVTILSGELYHETGEKLDKSKGSLLTAGGFISLPADMAHSLWTVKTTIIQVSGTGPFDLHYINPADDPRNDKNDPRNRK
jgi:quercetin dioxygenase-like cupin family protein